jgi:hypothetical protein
MVGHLCETPLLGVRRGGSPYSLVRAKSQSSI